MCSKVALTLLGLATQASSKELAMQHGARGDVQGNMTAELEDQALKMHPFHHADLDTTTLARTQPFTWPLSLHSAFPSQRAALTHSQVTSVTNKYARAVQTAPAAAAYTVARSPHAEIAASQAKMSVIRDPRAAVAVTTCRTHGPWDQGPWEFLFVQRSKPPRAGSWSVPSGKIHFGEDTLKAAAREIAEETNLTPNQGLRLYPSPLGISDLSFPIDSALIGSTLGVQLPAWLLPTTSFHYSIEVTAMLAFATKPNAPIIAGDDAANARWFTLHDLKTELLDVNERESTIVFLEKVEEMLANGVLQPDDALAVGAKQHASLQLFEKISLRQYYGAALMWICFSMYVIILTRTFIGMSREKSWKANECLFA